MAEPIVIRRGGDLGFQDLIGLGPSFRSVNPNQDIMNAVSGYFSSQDPTQEYLLDFGHTFQDGDYNLFRSLKAQDFSNYLAGKTPEQLNLTFNNPGDEAVRISGDVTAGALRGLFDDLGATLEYQVPEFLERKGEFIPLTDAQRREIGPAFTAEQAAKRDANRGFLSKYVAPALKFAVPAAIGLGGTLGLGGALGGFGSLGAGGAASSGLSSGALGLAQGGSLLPASAFGGAAGGLAGSLSSNLLSAPTGSTAGFSAATSPALSSGALSLAQGGSLIPSLSGQSFLSGALSGALKGGGLSALGGGDPADILLGAATGGLGSYITGGGAIPGLGNIGTQGSTGTGILGTVGRAGDFLGLTGNTGGSTVGLGSLLRGAGDIYSAYSAKSAQDEAKDALLRQAEAQRQALAPYLQAGQDAQARLQAAIASGDIGGEFTYDDLLEDPGYQFQLEEGEKALGRAQSARGSLYSGAALKAAQEYGQGLAQQNFADAYARDLQRQQNLYNTLSGQSSLGYGAAGQEAGIQAGIGNILAQSAIGREEQNQQLLSRILRGDSLGGFLGGLF